MMGILRDSEGLPMDYVQRIRSLREGRDLTQEQAAQVLQTSQAMYSRYERGRASCPSAT